jgi:hypothetical protein
MSASIKSNSSGNLELFSGSTKVLEANAGTGVVTFPVTPSNITALANGDAGAPRIISKAIVRTLPVTTGSIALEGDSLVRSFVTNGTWQVAANFSGGNLYTGTVTISAEHASQTQCNGSMTVSIRFVKNGVVLATWSTTSTSYTLRQFTTSVAFGDTLSIEVNGGVYNSVCTQTYFALTRNMKILANRKVITRQIPVYADEDGIYA